MSAWWGDCRPSPDVKGGSRPNSPGGDSTYQIGIGLLSRPLARPQDVTVYPSEAGRRFKTGATGFDPEVVDNSTERSTGISTVETSVIVLGGISQTLLSGSTPPIQSAVNVVPVLESLLSAGDFHPKADALSLGCRDASFPLRISCIEREKNVRVDCRVSTSLL